MNLIPDRTPSGHRRYAIALVVVTVSAILASALHVVVPHANLAMVFLLGVLVVAVRAGTRPALLASVLCFLTFNFLFIPPQYTFDVRDEGDVATLAFFLLIAVFAGHLAARIQAETQRSRKVIARLTDLNRFSRQLAAAADTDAVDAALREHLARCAGDTVEDGDLDGAGQSDLGEAMRELAEVARQRISLVADLERARVISDTEQLRSALLSSVSHDLRTPLSSIVGSASSLLEYGDSFSERDSRALLSNVLEEANRLNRYIQNLLDMTRLGGGELRPRCDWVDIADVISAALARHETDLRARHLELDIEPELPLVYVQGVLIEQCLVNILDNALRHTALHGRIAILVRRAGARLCIDVCDDGPGIAPDEREKIFDMFYTVRHADRRPGTGLGLAICRGLAAAHGGTVEAVDSPLGRGACIRIGLPLRLESRAA